MFLTHGFSAGDRPGNPADDFWFGPIAQPSASGAIVTAETGMRYSMVYKCARLYADSMGSMPRRLIRQIGDKRERVTDHPVARLLSVRPNAWQTPSMFVGMLEAHAQLRGTGYARIVLDRITYEPQALIPIHPDRVTVELMDDGSPRWRVKPPKGQIGPDEVLLLGEMFFVTTATMDGYTGLSPIDLQRESIGGAIASRDYGSRFWNNDARPPFWVKVPGKFKDNDQRKDFRDEWQVMYGGANKGRPAVLDRGMEINELGITNENAEFIASREYSDKDIAAIFRAPLHKVGILSDAKYANIEQQAIEWVTDSLLPRIIAWEEAVKRDLLLDGDDEDIFLKFVPDHLMRGDTMARFTAYQAAVSAGWITRNEIRALEDMDPLPGLSEPLQPLNMGSPGRAVLPAPPAPASDRSTALLMSAVARVARAESAIVMRIVAGKADADAEFAAHTRWLGQVLAVSEEHARAYCAEAQDKLRALTASGKAAQLTAEEWIETQTAALMRLGVN